jgi:hypothetical protein
MDEIESICGNCQWWESEVPVRGMRTSGQCRALPPRFNSVTGSTRARAIWPTTFEDDWCAAFKAEDPEDDAEANL